MGTIRWFLIASTIAALSATSSAQSVTYDFHRGEDFSRFRTFTFRDAPPADQEVADTTTYGSPLVADRIKAAVAAQLQGRGLKHDSDNPDVYVTTRQTFNTEYVTYGSYWDPWYGWGWGYRAFGYPYGGSWYTEEIIKGTVTIDLTAADGHLVWRGVAEMTVHPDAKPDKRTERVERAVSKVFRKFPWNSGAIGTAGHDVPRPR